MDKNDIISAYDHYLMNTYRRYPLILTKGDGVKVWDIDGKEYLDFLGGIAVNVLGHCHPAVVAAMALQAKELIHTSNLYYTKPAAELAKLLVLNGGLDKVFLCNSGAEANEGAIKLARKYQWRKGKKEKNKIISATHSFHGRTLATLAATQKPEIQVGFGPLPEGFEYFEWNNIESLQAHVDERLTAAVIIEPVQGEGGINLADRSFLEKARKVCDDAGVLLIFDEIQCGMGRLGSLFAYQSFGIKPDIITLAKGIAGGMPLGVVCATENVAKAFQPGDHGTTFGANPVTVAAAIAVLKVLIEENYPQKNAEIGAYLMQELCQLQQKFPFAIAEVRGKGLMIGLQLKIDGKSLIDNCLKQGLLANLTGENVLRLLPPYTINKADVRRAVQMLENALAAL